MYRERSVYECNNMNGNEYHVYLVKTFSLVVASPDKKAHF
jgi:hypothetical protein